MFVKEIIEGYWRKIGKWRHRQVFVLERRSLACLLNNHIGIINMSKIRSSGRSFRLCFTIERLGYLGR
jgi:hypothetical protein